LFFWLILTLFCRVERVSLEESRDLFSSLELVKSSKFCPDIAPDAFRAFDFEALHRLPFRDSTGPHCVRNDGENFEVRRVGQTYMEGLLHSNPCPSEKVSTLYLSTFSNCKAILNLLLLAIFLTPFSFSTYKIASGTFGLF